MATKGAGVVERTKSVRRVIASATRARMYTHSLGAFRKYGVFGIFLFARARRVSRAVTRAIAYIHDGSGEHQRRTTAAAIERGAPNGKQRGRE